MHCVAGRLQVPTFLSFPPSRFGVWGSSCPRDHRPPYAVMGSHAHPFGLVQRASWKARGSSFVSSTLRFSIAAPCSGFRPPMHTGLRQHMQSSCACPVAASVSPLAASALEISSDSGPPPPPNLQAALEAAHAAMRQVLLQLCRCFCMVQCRHPCSTARLNTPASFALNPRFAGLFPAPPPLSSTNPVPAGKHLEGEFERSCPVERHI